MRKTIRTMLLTTALAALAAGAADAKTLKWGANREIVSLDPYSYGDCISWDVLDSIFSPGAILLLASWKGLAPALDFAQSAMTPDDARTRAVGGVREYGIEGLAVATGGVLGDFGPGTPQGAANDR